MEVQLLRYDRYQGLGQPATTDPDPRDFCELRLGACGDLSEAYLAKFSYRPPIVVTPVTGADCFDRH